jgi:hypothetical protein
LRGIFAIDFVRVDGIRAILSSATRGGWGQGLDGVVDRIASSKTGAQEFNIPDRRGGGIFVPIGMAIGIEFLHDVIPPRDISFGVRRNLCIVGNGTDVTPPDSVDRCGTIDIGIGIDCDATRRKLLFLLLLLLFLRLSLLLLWLLLLLLLLVPHLQLVQSPP